MHIELGAVKKRSGIDMELFTTQYHKIGPRNNQCWNWVGDFYGPASFRPSTSNARQPAHKWIFETMIGSLPDRVVLIPDEHCTLSNEISKGKKNPNRGHCVNPEHYYAMTPLDAYRLDFAEPKTECVNGHPYTQDSVTYSAQNRQIFCRICRGEYTLPTEEQEEVTLAVEMPKDEETSLEQKDVANSTPDDEVSTKWLVKPDGPPRDYTNEEFDSFMAQTETRGPKNCLVWLGEKKPNHPGGIDQTWFTPARMEKIRAYRWLFEVTYGTLPEQTMLMEEEDCEPFCVHTDHRIPCDRSYYSSHRPKPRPRRFCKNGHEYVEGSFSTNSKGYRTCLLCAADIKARRALEARAERWIRWVAKSSQEELNKLVADMPQDQFDELHGQLNLWADEADGRVEMTPAEAQMLWIAADARLRTDEEELEEETIPVLNSETQLDPNAVQIKDTVVYTPQTGLKTVNGVLQRMTTEELIQRLKLHGLPAEAVVEALNEVEDKGRAVAPWLYADMVVDIEDDEPIGAEAAAQITEDVLMDIPELQEKVPPSQWDVWKTDESPDDAVYIESEEEDDEVSNEAFLQALRQIRTTDEMVPFTISAKVPLTLAGTTMLQILSALADADAIEVRFKK